MPSEAIKTVPPAVPSEFWNESLEHLFAGRAATGMRIAGDELQRIRERLTEPEWHAYTQTLYGSLYHRNYHQDPFTSRAYQKPRGYAGDAVMIDMMYGSASIPESTTPLGATIYSATVAGPAGSSVKLRRDFLADYIDTSADEFDHPDVLSVASGHLREGQRCVSLGQGRLKRIVALDQDVLSLAVVESEQAHLGVTTMHGSIRNLLNGSLRLEQFDVIYASGLYDYLPAPLASRLTHVLFSSLNRGGKLLIPNFAPELVDIGYMEAVMDWWLVYRSEAHMCELAANLPADEVSACRTFRDNQGYIVYLEVRRS